jgi:glycosyltransferase involved in cell wall biosynthesis
MIIFLFHEFKNGTKPDLIISHSLRSTFAIRLLSFNQHKIINTKIHQIPKLSDKNQRIKRFIYSQFATNLYSFSEAASQSWYEQFDFGAKLLRKYTRQIKTVRNGVYLGRIPQISQRTDGRRRIIFLGRPTFWKGLDILQKLAEHKDLKDFEFLFIVPSFDENLFSEIQKTLGERMGFIEGKSFGDLELFEGDVHLYPSQYGRQVNRFESVSINCLEMACLGIPSLVTMGGNLTWREHEFSKIFIEVDWSNLEDVASKIKETSEIRFESTDLHYFKGKIDIKNELKALVKE